MQNRLEMEKEDLLSQLVRRCDKLASEREETRRFRDDVLRQKEEWSDAF